MRWFIGAACAAAFAGIFAAQSFAATSTAPLAARVCNSEAEITRFFGPSVKIVAYMLPVAESAKLVAYMAEVFKQPPRSPIQNAWIVILNNGDAGFTFMGPDGCGVEAVYPLDLDELSQTLDSIGVASPAGNTYHQLPNSPGALPGFGI